MKVPSQEIQVELGREYKEIAVVNDEDQLIAYYTGRQDPRYPHLREVKDIDNSKVLDWRVKKH